MMWDIIGKEEGMSDVEEEGGGMAKWAVTWRGGCLLYLELKVDWLRSLLRVSRESLSDCGEPTLIEKGA